MSHFYSDSEVWEQITSISATCVQKRAAVSYVTSDSILKFSSNDLLVLDASIESVKRGSTSASVIKRAISRGANVVSMPELHAKVMIFDATAVVGSANISVRSAKTLREAISVLSDVVFVEKANRWIEALAQEGQQIDEPLLNRLLEIEAEREPIQRSLDELAETHIVFFKEVLQGDVEKYNIRSSTAGTGGGARDLRVSPADVFRPLLSQMISERTDDERFTRGPVLSQSNGILHIIDIELWRPTDSRPNELRIGRIHAVPGWDVSDADFAANQANNVSMFYVLEMDVHGTVTEKVLTELQLTQEHGGIARLIAELRARDGGRFAITGAADVVNENFVG